ncbi:cytochrome P450 [Nocardia alni]|uniref:cytochrome P450 n=1 Tax=Nocardia alni TaxID=2815723 RepID=UPI001C236078|nr:cytochrome P450 [Nocardia alni]
MQSPEPVHAALADLVGSDPATVRCPFATYARLRSEGGVHWSADLHAFVVTRYETVTTVAKSPEVFSSEFVSGPGGTGKLARSIVADPHADADLKRMAARRARIADDPVLINADPPKHRHQRRLVNPVFRRARILALEQTVTMLIDQLIDEFAGGGDVEFVRAFAGPLPMTMIARVLGVPEDRMDDFRRWSEAITGATGATPKDPEVIRRIFTDMDEFFVYFANALADRRARPLDDVLTDLLAVDNDGRSLHEDEILGMVAQFLTAGNETTTALLASALLRLAENPGEAAELRANPEAVPAYIEEILRLRSPIQGLFRTARRDTVLDGVAIAAGSFVWIAYASGNRDETVYADAECLRPGREKSTHLSFGHGEHTCLGAPLARLEAVTAIRALLRRFERIELRDTVADIPFRPNFVMHAPLELPLNLTPAP